MRTWSFPVVVLSAAILAGCGLLPSAPRSGTEARQPAPPLEVAAPGTLAQGERVFRIIPGQSIAWYEAQEKWLRWQVPTKAVAKTRDVEGEFVLATGDQPRLAANHFRVDMGTLLSEVADTPLPPVLPASVFLAQRDGAVRSRMDVSRFPFAEFRATGMEGLPAWYAEGQAVKVRVAGNLTLRDVTRPVVFETEATLEGDTLGGIAATQVLMTDFGIQPPSGGGTEVEDLLSIVIQFRATADPTQTPPVLTDRHPKLDYTLSAVAQIARDRGAADALHEARQRGLDVEDGSVRVNVQRQSARAEVVRAGITAAGGHVEVEDVSVAQVLLPVSAIEEIMDMPFVLAVRTPLREGLGAAGGQ